MDIKQFYEFCYQRQLIWHKRHILKQAGPWTEDPILSKYKFCNVYRENDAATQHLLKHVINTASFLEDKLFNIIWFRFFNTTNFFDVAAMPRHYAGFRAKDYIKDWNKLRAQGVKLKNEAIHTTGNLYPGKPHRVQWLMLTEKIAKGIPMLKRGIQSETSLENYFNVIRGIKYVGPFLSFQIAQDIAYIPELPKVDWNAFVHVGPGSIEGLKLMGLNGKPETECDYLFQHQEKYLPAEWKIINYKGSYYPEPWLSLANIQHSICEARKFFKLNEGKGRKRYYKPGGSDGTKRP